MQALLAMTLFGFASCGHLSNSYLPPFQRTSAIGTGAGFGSGAGFGGGAGAGFGGGFGAGAPAAAYNVVPTGPPVPIVRQNLQNEGDGSYHYAYETANGISAEEQGDARGEAGTRAQGGYSFTLPDGQHVHLSYTADENGFVAQGSHIPTPPPVPEEIRRAIEQNIADEARGLVDDGSYRENQYGGGEYRSEYRAAPNTASGGYRY